MAVSVPLVPLRSRFFDDCAACSGAGDDAGGRVHFERRPEEPQRVHYVRDNSIRLLSNQHDVCVYVHRCHAAAG